jgi:pimeloyl-ACP methyl ester carboxylesterase
VTGGKAKESQMSYVIPEISETTVRVATLHVEGLNIFYREAGSTSQPKLVLLHGFPASSHQYRNLIPALADRFHVIAMDYVGFGNSDMPNPSNYSYTFEKTSEVVEEFLKKKGFARFGLFVQDYGGPVGFRILSRKPGWLEWLIIQNTNAYEAGFTPAWDGFRNALWKNRSPETERPLTSFWSWKQSRASIFMGTRSPS